jgi:hypothetical protein
MFRVCNERHGTHPFDHLQSGGRALPVVIFRDLQRVFGDAVCQFGIGFPSEGSPSEQQLVCTYTEGPPIDRVSVSSLSKDLRSHVCERACDARMHATVIEMNGNVEISEMGIPTFVQKDIVGFEVAVLMY